MFEKIYKNSIIENPKSTLLILIVILFSFGYFAKDFQLDASSDTLLLENHSGIKWDEELEEYLIENKYPYRLINYPAMFGRVFGIQLDQKSNKWIGVADPDWEGTVESN